VADSQMFPSPVELVKLQSHFRLPVQYAAIRDGSFAAAGEVDWQALWNQADADGSGLSRDGRSIPP
jgi:hypothetical protein